MTKIQRKALYTSLAFVFIGGVYAVMFDTPIYGLDILSLTFIVLVTVSFLGIVWHCTG